MATRLTPTAGGASGTGRRPPVAARRASLRRDGLHRRRPGPPGPAPRRDPGRASRSSARAATDRPTFTRSTRRRTRAVTAPTSARHRAATRRSARRTSQAMAALGFNSVRLPLSWSLLEPQRGRFNQTYVDRVAQVVGWARELRHVRDRRHAPERLLALRRRRRLRASIPPAIQRRTGVGDAHRRLSVAGLPEPARAQPGGVRGDAATSGTTATESRTSTSPRSRTSPSASRTTAPSSATASSTSHGLAGTCRPASKTCFSFLSTGA